MNGQLLSRLAGYQLLAIGLASAAFLWLTPAFGDYYMGPHQECTIFVFWLYGRACATGSPVLVVAGLGAALWVGGIAVAKNYRSVGRERASLLWMTGLLAVEAVSLVMLIVALLLPMAHPPLRI